jgi:hypothetical protein
VVAFDARRRMLDAETIFGATSEPSPERRSEFAQFPMEMGYVLMTIRNARDDAMQILDVICG